jgi:predicted GNAT family N-acyltransferase
MKKIIQIKQVRSNRAKAQALAIRMRVFVREQGVPKEIELDRDDERALHFLATVDGKPVGTARLVLRRGNAKIGRMAVLKQHRRKGIGTRLLKRTIMAAKRRRVRVIFLHAQVPVIGFYEKMGFRCTGAVFDEAGIPHRKMLLMMAPGSRKQTTVRKKTRTLS